MGDRDPVTRLREVRGLVFDMDGTLVLGDRRNHGLRPLPGALEVTRWVAGRGLPWVVFTTGTNRTPAHFARLLREIGFGVPDEAVMLASRTYGCAASTNCWRSLLLLKEACHELPVAVPAGSRRMRRLAATPSGPSVYPLR